MCEKFTSSCSYIIFKDLPPVTAPAVWTWRLCKAINTDLIMTRAILIVYCKSCSDTLINIKNIALMEHTGQACVVEFSGNSHLKPLEVHMLLIFMTEESDADTSQELKWKNWEKWDLPVLRTLEVQTL